MHTRHTEVMRLIERQMIDAIRQGKDWRKDNTKVVQFYNDKDYPVVTSVFLHGNKIAEIDASRVQIFDGGLRPLRGYSACTQVDRAHEEGWLCR